MEGNSVQPGVKGPTSDCCEGSWLPSAALAPWQWHSAAGWCQETEVSSSLGYFRHLAVPKVTQILIFLRGYT